MTQSEMKFANMMGRIMMAIGGLGVLATVILRVWLTPGTINSTNGMLDAPWVVIACLALCLVGLFVISFMVGGFRRDIRGKGATILGFSLLATGVLLAFGEGEMLWMSWQENETLKIIQGALGVLSAGVLALLAARILSEGGVRRGISQWSMLVPVFWMWVRIVNYEMSESSLARIEDIFFCFSLLIFELLFLFKFARFIAGIGVVRTGFMLFYSIATAMVALSSSIILVVFYLMNDGMALEAYGSATLADLAMVILAVSVAVTQLMGEEQIQSEEFELPEEESAGKDLIMSSVDEGENAEPAAE